MTKMAYENYKASYEKDGIFLKILERLQTFFSLPESSKIESIQRYFRCIIYRAKMISIPFFRNDFNSHLRGQWKHNKSLTKTSKITYLIWNNQKKKDSTWFAKIESKYRSRNATLKIEKSDLRHVNLPFVSAVKKVPSRKVDMLQLLHRSTISAKNHPNFLQNPAFESFFHRHFSFSQYFWTAAFIWL